MSKKEKPEKAKKQKKEKKPGGFLRRNKGSATIDGMPNYQVYTSSKSEFLAGYLIGVLLSALVVEIYFYNLPLGAIIGLGVGFITADIYAGMQKQKRLKALLLQFRDLMESLVASYSVGGTTKAAFTDAAHDLEQIYGSDADMVKEMHYIQEGMASQIPIEEMLSHLAMRAQLEDISNFASIFEEKGEGVDMRTLVSETREIINEKMDIEIEIATIVSGAQNELYIMMCMPFLLMAVMNSVGDETLSGLTLINILTRLLSLGTIVAAYFIGKKMVDINA